MPGQYRLFSHARQPARIRELRQSVQLHWAQQRGSAVWSRPADWMAVGELLTRDRCHCPEGVFKRYAFHEARHHILVAQADIVAGLQIDGEGDRCCFATMGLAEVRLQLAALKEVLGALLNHATPHHRCMDCDQLLIRDQ